MSRTSRILEFAKFLQEIAAFVYTYGNGKIGSPLDSTRHALRGRTLCARFLSRSTEESDLRIVKVSDAIFRSNLGLKLPFLSCSVAIVCRSGNDVSPCIHHPFIFRSICATVMTRGSRSKTLLLPGNGGRRRSLAIYVLELKGER